jgi:hypothetical protein
MSTLAVQILAAVLSVVFAWSASAKLLRYQEWRIALAGYRLPVPVERAARAGVPIVELLVPLLFIAGNVAAGAALVMALVGAFSLAVLRARSLEGDRLPCGCFGRGKARDYRVMLLRNSVLGTLAAALLVAGRDVRLFEGVGAPDGSEVIPITLSVAGLVAAGWAVWMASCSFRKGQH